MSHIDIHDPVAVDNLLRRLHTLVEQDELRNKYLESILGEMKIYNRSVPTWLIYTLTFMGLSQLITMIAVVVLFSRISQ